MFHKKLQNNFENKVQKIIHIEHNLKDKQALRGEEWQHMNKRQDH